MIAHAKPLRISRSIPQPQVFVLECVPVTGILLEPADWHLADSTLAVTHRAAEHHFRGSHPNLFGAGCPTRVVTSQESCFGE